MVQFLDSESISSKLLNLRSFYQYTMRLFKFLNSFLNFKRKVRVTFSGDGMSAIFFNS